MSRWNRQLKDFVKKKCKGILTISEYPLIITYRSKSRPDADKNWHTPSSLLFSSDDGEVDRLKPYLDAEDYVSPTNYRLYSITRSDAFGIQYEAADYQYENQSPSVILNWESWLDANKEGTLCTATAVRYEQYVMIRMENAGLVVISRITLPDDLEGDVYISLTCERCEMSNFKLIREPEAIEAGTITPAVMRKPEMPTTEGDIPNLDCPGWWTTHSVGIEITNDPLYITYDSISYPQAREKWHTPLVVVFASLDQMVGGPAYTEFSVTRSDAFGWYQSGINFSCQPKMPNDWTSWEDWLEDNKNGVKCSITAVRKESTIIITMENNGLISTTQVDVPYDVVLPVCLAISGELCAISNIKIEHLFSKRK